MHLLALAALSILSLMPVYHRFYDTRLLLLTVPAVLIVFQKRRFLGATIAVVTALQVFSVQYRLEIFLIQHDEWKSVLQNKLLFLLLLRQQNLEADSFFLPVSVCYLLYSLFQFPGYGLLSSF